jgi:hypothetical protein
VKKENICAPALAFVFAWHRIGAIAAYGLSTCTGSPKVHYEPGSGLVSKRDFMTRSH